MHSKEVVDRLKPASREIALDVRQANVSLRHAGWTIRLGTAQQGTDSYLVLDGLIAPHWGHILRHCGGWYVNN